MPSSMPYDRARRNIIRQLMTDLEADAGGKDSLPQQKLIVQGTASLEPVYHMPLDSLLFNKSNGRIKAETAEKESELGRDLDANDSGDAEIIQELLLSIRQEENEKVSADLRTNGQMLPGLITCDGIIINGNRRRALLQGLYRETSDSKYSYLDVQVLPSTMTKAELWLIEAGI